MKLCSVSFMLTLSDQTLLDGFSPNLTTESGHLVTAGPPALVRRPRIPRPSWITLPARPESVARARRFAADIAAGHTLDGEHAYTVRLVTSELVTNAVAATCALRAWAPSERPLRLDVTACNRWVHLAVTDPDHRPLPAVDEGGTLAEHGRGLSIVDAEAATRWVRYGEHAKTVHAVVVAPDGCLSPEELAALRRV